MGHTLIEKLVAARVGREVNAGDVVWLPLDVMTARDFGGASVVKNFREAYGNDAKVIDPRRIFFTFDCNAPANTVGYATNQMICRDFAQEQEIRVFDVDAGIGSHILIEQGLARPGATAIGTDSHYNILGAVGALGMGMGDVDVAFAFRNGKVWFEVPPTVRVNVEGRLKWPATAKDLTLAIVGHFGSSGLLGQAVEFYGEVIDSLGIAGRITLASMATEMSAVIALLPPSELVLDFVEGRSGTRPEPVLADADANCQNEITLHLGEIEPMIAVPYSPANVKPVRELAAEKVRIHTGFVGSCTNGRFGDFAVVAEMLAGARVADGVTLKMVPTTKEVYGELMKSGVLAKLFDAGALISNQGCGGCASGQIGMTGEGEVQVSTANRNFKGKQGAGRTYLASPATVAASVKAGYITAPEVD